MNLDDLFAHPDAPDCDMVVDFEAGDLREVREKITGTGWDRGYEFAAQNPHPRLWRLLAEKALEELDFAGAEKAFVSAEDYAGLQLVKQLRCMPDRNKAKAEIAVYMKRFDEAESIYRGIDRKDLALEMRTRVGDYSRVVHLLQTGGGNDRLMRQAWDNIGTHYADRVRWRKAMQYFLQSKNLDGLAECYYRLQMLPELRNLANEVT